MLGEYIKKLYMLLAAMIVALSTPVQAGLQEGVVLPAVLAVKSIDGQATQVPLRGSVPVMLYVMSPTCGW